MIQMVCLNVGGKQYKVSCSLLDMHPNSVLAQIISEQWLSSPNKEVFIERDGERFRFVLDYLKNDGHVFLPMTVPIPLLLADLTFYGIENVDESKIICKYGIATQNLAHAVSTVHAAFSTSNSADVKAEIKALELHCAIVKMAEECAIRYLISGGKLKIVIPAPRTILSMENCRTICFDDTWMALLFLLCETRTSILPHAQEGCNQYLSKVGLEIVSAEEVPDKCIIQIEMKLTDM